MAVSTPTVPAALSAVHDECLRRRSAVNLLDAYRRLRARMTAATPAVAEVGAKAMHTSVQPLGVNQIN
jgi:hypothetical protein